ncbi:MAG: hypothetical protein JXQ65_05135 [Candidatus Marinimicrobia bacterium]|nr:hypothetical protein [Candidatus Neomarinimicrobiota bacterium]
MVKKFIFFFGFYLSCMIADTDSLMLMDYEEFNFSEAITASSYLLYPSDEWGTQGFLSVNGLPAFANDYQYNGFSVKDPLYGNVPFSWLNPKYSRIEIDENEREINQEPVYNSNKNLYSRFDWLYRGSYSLGSFGAIISGKINNNYSITVHGENFSYPGPWGINDKNRSTSVEHNLSQEIGVNIKKDWDSGVVESGFNYKKIFPGINDFQTTSNGNEILQTPVYDGYLKKFKKQLYLKYSNNDSLGNFTIGGQVLQFDYGYFPEDTMFRYSGQGDIFSAQLTKSRNFSRDSLFLKINFDFYGIYLKKKQDSENPLLAISILDEGRRAGFDYCLSAGFVNQNFIYSLKAERAFSKTIQIGIFSGLKVHRYPIVYTLYPGVEKTPFQTEDFFRSRTQSFFLSMKNRFLNFQNSLDHVSGNFYRPYKSSNEDTHFILHNIKLRDFYINSRLTMTFPWKMLISGKLQYSPTVNVKEFNDLFVYGSIEQKTVLFKGNLHLYAQGSIAYYSGGDNLNWFQEFQTAGMTDENYYTNVPLCFSAKIGFHVGSLHMFYQFNNIENRQYAVMQSMPLQYRISVLGIDWYFWN